MKRNERALLLITDHYGWQKWTFPEGAVAFCGWLETEDGHVRSGIAAGRYLAGFLNILESLEDVERLAISIKGNFAFFLCCSRGIAAGVDRKRSYPAFYGRKTEGDWLWSNNARHLKKSLGDMDRDDVSWLEFEMAGYVTGPYTLFSGLYQLQAGECAWYDFETQEVAKKRYFTFFSRVREDKDEKIYLKELIDISHDIFNRLIHRLAGRRVWIPLSGGLDSRFILAMLKEKGYKGIEAYAYGAPGNKNWEVRYSREFAESLNVSWRFIPLTSEYLRRIYHSPLWTDYGRYADNLCSLPDYQNMIFPLQYIRERENWEDGDLVINGQSGDFVTGNHLPLNLDETTWTAQMLVDQIFDKHFSLWVDLKTPQNLSIIEKRLDDVWKTFVSSGDFQSQAAQLEAWEWQERQAKYVVNGQRGYEFYGLSWELPLWDDAFLMFWSSVPYVYKRGQSLYQKMLRTLNPSKGFRNYRPDRRPPFLYYCGSRVACWLFKLYPFEETERLKRRLLTGWMDPNNFHAVITGDEDRCCLASHRNIISYYARRHKRELLKRMD